MSFRRVGLLAACCLFLVCMWGGVPSVYMGGGPLSIYMGGGPLYIYMGGTGGSPSIYPWGYRHTCCTGVPGVRWCNTLIQGGPPRGVPSLYTWGGPSIYMGGAPSIYTWGGGGPPLYSEGAPPPTYMQNTKYVPAHSPSDTSDPTCTWRHLVCTS